MEHDLESTDTTAPETATMGFESEEHVSIIAPLPPMSDILSQIHALEIIPFSSNAAVSADYLHRAGKALYKSKWEERAGTRQLLITELVEKTDKQ